jgi:hypothetical protein
MIRLTRTVSMSANNGPPAIRRRLAVAAVGLVSLAVAGCAAAGIPDFSVRLTAYRSSLHHRGSKRDPQVARRRHRHRGHRRTHTKLASADQASCAASDMSLRWVTMTAGMFHYADMYALTNTGTSTCTLEGFPAVRMSDTPTSGGAAVPVSDAVQDDGTAPWGAVPTQITLQPGTAAGLIISYVADPNNPACLTPTTFAVTLPGASSSLTSDRTGFNVCAGGQVYVSPILQQAQQFPTSEP